MLVLPKPKTVTVTVNKTWNDVPSRATVNATLNFYQNNAWNHLKQKHLISIKTILFLHGRCLNTLRTEANTTTLLRKSLSMAIGGWCRNP